MLRSRMLRTNFQSSTAAAVSSLEQNDIDRKIEEKVKARFREGMNVTIDHSDVQQMIDAEINRRLPELVNAEINRRLPALVKAAVKEELEKREKHSHSKSVAAAAPWNTSHRCNIA